MSPYRRQLLRDVRTESRAIRSDLSASTTEEAFAIRRLCGIVEALADEADAREIDPRAIANETTKRARNGGVCGAQWKVPSLVGVFCYCTLPVRHDGEHVASSLGDEVVARWAP